MGALYGGPREGGLVRRSDCGSGAANRGAMTAVFIDSGMPALRALARLGAIKKKKPVPVGRPGRLRGSRGELRGSLTCGIGDTLRAGAAERPAAVPGTKSTRPSGVIRRKPLRWVIYPPASLNASKPRYLHQNKQSNACLPAQRGAYFFERRTG